MNRYDERVSAFMQTEFVTLRPSDRLDFADDVMELGQIRLIRSWKRIAWSAWSPVGMIGETDLLRAV